MGETLNTNKTAGTTFKPVIDCTIQSARWRKHLPRAKSECAAVIAVALAAAGIPVSSRSGHILEISLVLADNAFVQDLNRNYRGMDKPTNVLSFPALDEKDLKRLKKPPAKKSPLAPELLLGDIILALETVEAEAKAGDKSIKEHIYHLVVHGLLHLIGYDHANDVEAEQMEKLETAILASMGISDPYAVKE